MLSSYNYPASILHCLHTAVCWRTFTLYALEKKCLNKLIFKQPFQTFVLSSPHPGHFINFMILCNFFVVVILFLQTK